MNLENILYAYHQIKIDLTEFIKDKIAKELDIKTEDCCFKDVENGFEFIWDGEIEGNVRITFGTLCGNHVCIETENAWDAADLYKLINKWLDELERQ